MRWHNVEIFKTQLLPIHAALSNIGIVGGHINELELSVLNSKDFTFYGVQPNPGVETIHFDLNNPRFNQGARSYSMFSSVGTRLRCDAIN